MTKNINEKKIPTLIFRRKLSIVFLLTSVFAVEPLMAMEDDNDLPTEYRIPNKSLVDDSANRQRPTIFWEDAIYEQTGGTCGSHAASDCLRYVHDLRYVGPAEDIMPYYLHKNTHFQKKNKDKNGNPAWLNYETGHSTIDLMKYTRDYGVPETPMGHKFVANSGRDFPAETTQYAFKKIYDVFEGKTNLSSIEKVNKVKKALFKHKAPVILSVKSTVDNDRIFTNFIECVPDHFLKNNRNNTIDSFLNINNTIDWLKYEINYKKNIYINSFYAFNKCNNEDLLNKFMGKPYTFEEDKNINYNHAVVAYGYSERKNAFLIKNSWGTDFRSHGKALLQYQYLDLFINNNPYMGLGAKKILNKKDSYTMSVEGSYTLSVEDSRNITDALNLGKRVSLRVDEHLAFSSQGITLGTGKGDISINANYINLKHLNVNAEGVSFLSREDSDLL